jgi:hypothetical protein
VLEAGLGREEGCIDVLVSNAGIQIIKPGIDLICRSLIGSACWRSISTGEVRRFKEASVRKTPYVTARQSQRLDIDPFTLSIEAKLRRAGKGKRLVIANGAEAEINAGLVELIKDAFTIRIQLLSGLDASIEAMGRRLGMNKCRWCTEDARADTRKIPRHAYHRWRFRPRHRGGLAPAREGGSDRLRAQVLADPDLPERFRSGASLNADDPTTYYGGRIGLCENGCERGQDRVERLLRVDLVQSCKGLPEPPI